LGLSIKAGNNVAGRRAKTETGYVLMMKQRQSREIKLKELKYEGHIALGK
jgi:hypothetical protein